MHAVLFYGHSFNPCYHTFFVAFAVVKPPYPIAIALHVSIFQTIAFDILIALNSTWL